jgi:hypothetical protein
MKRTLKVWPPDARKTPLYRAWEQARELFYAHGFDQSRYDAVRRAHVAYLASVAP